MTKKEAQKWADMMADYLQNKYMFFKRFYDTGESETADIVWSEYCSICSFLEAIGCEWRRNYIEKTNTYTHHVWFPDFKRLNFDAWK